MDTCLQGFYRLSLAHDAVEGKLSVTLACRGTDAPEKSKLSVSSSATVSDEEVKASLKLGLFSYPVLQAADILVYR